MQNRMIVICLLLILILSACNDENVRPQEEIKTSTNNQPNKISAQIIKVYTDMQKEFGWWVIPKGVNKITIFVEAKNTETVLFWVIPTGTQTWNERKLIGLDIDESNGWSFTWEFGDRALHDHIYIQALGSDDSTLADTTINVTSVE